jgi:aminobenzoyl-glutamate utilization protein B
MHYVVKEGGKVPNVVPDHAKLWLWVRDSTREGVRQVVDRVEQIAEGAAVATGTSSTVNRLGSYHEMLVNMTGAEALQRNLEMIGPISYTEEEINFAKQIQREGDVEEKGMVCEVKELETPKEDPEGGSTDVAEVSWITPTLHLYITTAPYGIPWHSWAVVSASKHSIGHKGMLFAGKIIATTSLDLLTNGALRKRMTDEFRKKLGGYTYKSGIPPGKELPVRIK